MPWKRHWIEGVRNGRKKRKRVVRTLRGLATLRLFAFFAAIPVLLQRSSASQPISPPAAASPAPSHQGQESAANQDGDSSAVGCRAWGAVFGLAPERPPAA